MSSVVNSLIIGLFLTNPLFWIVIILGIVAAILGKKIVGKAGEFWEKSELNNLNKNEYLIINDVTIKNNNFTHQIDHIVVSRFGIFVIETKQWNGYIKGNEYDNKWIQNNKIYINNPIHQNYGHVKCLEEVLQLNEKLFIPIVCIPSRAKLNVKVTKNYIARSGELNKIILSYQNQVIPNYIEIYNKINDLNITDKEIKKQHTEQVKEIKRKKTVPNDPNICPQCGGRLVERTGKNGRFIGCSNYPKCRYTRNV